MIDPDFSMKRGLMAVDVTMFDQMNIVVDVMTKIDIRISAIPVGTCPMV